MDLDDLIKTFTHHRNEIHIQSSLLLFLSRDPGLVIVDAQISFPGKILEHFTPQMRHGQSQIRGGALVILDGIEYGLVCLRCLGDLGFRKDLNVVLAQA